jgi:hypothetical protein
MAINLVASLHRGEKSSSCTEIPQWKDSTGLFPFVMVERILTSADGARSECSPSKTKGISYDTLLEVQQVGDLMQSIYEELCLMKMTG